MGRKVIGVICIVLAIVGILSASSTSNESVSPAIFFAVIGLFLLLKKGKSREEKEQQQAKKLEEKERQSRMLTVAHMAGLPQAEGATCTLTFSDDGVSILSGGNTFRVAMEKITGLDIKTSTEIQQAYVSSIGGAVGGALLFGPLGAMVGGRAKKKTSKTVEEYFIITYLKENDVDYLSFKLLGLEGNKARKLVQRYAPLLTHRTVDL